MTSSWLLVWYPFHRDRRRPYMSHFLLTMFVIWLAGVVNGTQIKDHFETISINCFQTCMLPYMMASSNGNIFRVTGHLCGEFTGPRWIPRTKASDAELWCFFYLRPNILLSKQSWGWWIETPSHPLWRLCNETRQMCCLFLLIWYTHILLRTFLDLVRWLIVFE